MEEVEFEEIGGKDDISDTGNNKKKDPRPGK